VTNQYEKVSVICSIIFAVMSELTQREKLITEQYALQQILEEHQYEIDLLNTNINDVQQLLNDFNTGLDQNPWETYKVRYNLDQDDK
jgi:hypothetical protein